MDARPDSFDIAQVTSYDDSTGAMHFNNVYQSTNDSDSTVWNINLTGVPGVQGPASTQFPSWSSVNGHIIPNSNADFDIGSAEYKVRHLFLSDNSLWIGNDNKLSISNGKVKAQRRKTSQVPANLQAVGVSADSADLVQFRSGRQMNALTPADWLNYAKQRTGNQSITLNQLYSSQDFDQDTDWEDYLLIDQPTVGDVTISGTGGQTATVSQINSNTDAIAAIDTSGIATNAAAIAAIDTSGIATNAAAIAAIDTSGIATNAAAITAIEDNKHSFSEHITLPEGKKVSFLNDGDNERGSLRFSTSPDENELQIRVSNAGSDITKNKTISLWTTGIGGLESGEPEGEVKVVGKLRVYEYSTNTWHNIVDRIESNDTASTTNATNIATLTDDFNAYVPERLGAAPGAQVYTENLNGGINLNAPKGNTEASIRMNTVGGTPDGDIVLGMVEGPLGAFGVDNITLSMRELVGLLRGIKTAVETSTDGDDLRSQLLLAFADWDV